MANTTETLFERAREKFELTSTEKTVMETLCRAFVHGEVANYSSDDKERNDPARGKQWGKKRTLQADWIFWLCTDPKAAALSRPKGLRVVGAKVEGSLDLKYATLDMPLSFVQCAFTASLIFEQAQIRGLDLSGTHVFSISADSINVKGDVFLSDGFKSEGDVRLPGATIGGQFICNGGHFVNKDGNALTADGMNVTADVFLRDGFKSEGDVRLPGATIGGQFNCNGGHFVNKDGNALCADGMNVKHSIHLSDGFMSEGDVRLLNTVIGGVLNCIGGQFGNKNGNALSADGMNVAGDVFLRDGFKSEGEVRLPGAVIGGILDCSGSQFLNKDGNALTADGMNVTGDVFLRGGFKSEGDVRLAGATIGGQFDCSGGHFVNKDGNALTANTMNVTGGVFLNDGFKAEGAVSLMGAAVGNYLVLTNIIQPELMTLDLRSATIGSLWDEAESWPQEDGLHLSGLVYGAINEKAPLDSKQRLLWLRLQPKRPFSQQSYEHLAQMLRASGNDPAAKRVLIGKERDHKRRGEMSIWGKIWNVLVDGLIAHGYRPHQALLYVVFFVILGAGLFGAGHPQLFLETRETTPDFNAVVYSLDVFIPIVDLHQESYWLPDARLGELAIVPPIGWPQWGYWGAMSLIGWPQWGNWLRIYFWIHISCGWILSSLWVAGLTGLVRKD